MNQIWDEAERETEFDAVNHIIHGRSVTAAVAALEQRYSWLRHGDIRAFVSAERFADRQNKAAEAREMVRRFVDRALDTRPDQPPPAAAEPQQWWRRLITRLTGGSL